MYLIGKNLFYFNFLATLHYHKILNTFINNHTLQLVLIEILLPIQLNYI